MSAIIVFESSGLDLFSQTLAGSLSSALECLTSLFGMGKGGSTPLKRPKGSNTKVCPILSKDSLKSEQK